ncbi:hypothetical protein DIZ27_31005 [Streptomyces sp. NWU339]|nr:hypothetical protein DIZ27_31005 [Streptomyces sp. NWU339]
MIAKHAPVVGSSPAHPTHRAPGAGTSGAATARQPCTLGHPPIRGVIVLTVKLFGETLKAPRTLAVWHG